MNSMHFKWLNLWAERTLCWIFPGEKCIIGPAISLDAASEWHITRHIVRAVLSRVTPACSRVSRGRNVPPPILSSYFFPSHPPALSGSQVVALTLHRSGRDARELRRTCVKSPRCCSGRRRCRCQGAQAQEILGVRFVHKGIPLVAKKN